MRFSKGDLVVHAQGTLFPEGHIKGVVMEVFGENSNFYKVFWYTTRRYQNLTHGNLMPLSHIYPNHEGKTE